MMSSSVYFSDSSSDLSHPSIAKITSKKTASTNKDSEVLVLSSDDGNDDYRKVSSTTTTLSRSKPNVGAKRLRRSYGRSSSPCSTDDEKDGKSMAAFPPRKVGLTSGTAAFRRKQTGYHHSDDDDDDDSSLDIVGSEGKGPVLKKKAIAVDESDDDNDFAASAGQKRLLKVPKPSYLNDSTSDDDDDDLLKSGGCTFSQQSTGSRTSAITAIESTAETKAKGRKKPALDRVAQREAEKRAKAEEKARQKRLRQEAKEAERRAKAEERARQKRLRQEAKEEEKAKKQSARTMARQRMGKFAEQEVLVLVEPLLGKSVRSRPILDQLKETYRVMEYPGSARGLIQFVRQDYVAGGARGAQDALEESQERKDHGFELQNRIVVVFEDPAVFLKLLERSDVDDDYPLLEDWVFDLQQAWKQQWGATQDPSVVLLLPGVMDEVARQWNSHRRQRRPRPPPSDTEVKDAIVWMLIQCRVELVPLEDDYHATLDFLLKMTRSLSESPYNQQATELECIKKEKSGLLNPTTATASEKARDTWIRMLRSIPRMSEARAAHLASYYPTARSLWEAYQDPTKSEGEKKMMVAGLIDDGKCHAKISTMIYKIMSGRDGDEILV